MVHKPGQGFYASIQNIGRPARHGVQVLLCYICLSIASAEDVYLSVEEALQLAFPDAASISAFTPSLTQDQAQLVMSTAHASVRGKLDQVFIAHTGNKLDGIAFIDNAIGRTEYFTYCCALNSDGSIKRIDVLVYREPYGNEIRKRSWLGRFEGKTFEDNLRHKRDIPNISGATLSSKGMAERVRFLLTYHELVLQHQAGKWLSTQAGSEGQPKTVSVIEESAIIGQPQLRISLPTQQPQTRDQLIDAARHGIEQAHHWDKLINTWNPDSELSRCLAATVSQPSSELAAFIDSVFHWHALSAGSVDPSIKPILMRWQRAVDEQVKPTAEEIRALLALCGLDKCQWDTEAQQLQIVSGMQWDVSALAKGWIVDRVFDALQARKVHGIINYGESSYRSLGLSERIAIRDPVTKTGSAGFVTLTPGQALASSASYHRTLLIDGQRFGHFVNPRNGSLMSPDRAATVIAADAVTADAVASMACILPADEALRIIEQLDGCEALLWVGEKRLQSSSWPGLTQE